MTWRPCAAPSMPTRGWSTSPTRTIRPAPGTRAEQVSAFLRGCRRRVVVALDEAYFEYSRRVDCPDGIELLARLSEPGGAAHLLQGACAGRRARGLCDLASGGGRPAQSRAPAVQREHSRPGRGAGSARRRGPGRVAPCNWWPMALRSCAPSFRALGVKLHPTAGNFVLADVGGNGTGDLRTAAAPGRDRAAHGRLWPARCVRITIGTAAQNERLIAALAQRDAGLRRTHDADYRVQPARAVSGRMRVPGDKSISHRSLMLGGIAEGAPR